MLCDEDNKCQACRTGYYLKKLDPEDVDGVCVSCVIGCLECESEAKCQRCQEGRVKFSNTCPYCSSNCASCAYESDNCTSCELNYKLDQNNHCYFRYTIHLVVIAAIIAVLLLVFLKLLAGCLWPDEKLKKPKKFKEPVLDADSRKNTFFVQDKRRIGLLNDENEISRVESREPIDEEGNWIVNDQSVNDVLSEGGLLPDTDRAKRLGAKRGYESIR